MTDLLDTNKGAPESIQPSSDSQTLSEVSTYVLITPVRNEEKTIESTILSVVHQTIRPLEWLIVSDGSTDSTDDIVRKYSVQNPWIRLLPLLERPARNFASVVFAVEYGLGKLSAKTYSFIGLLDADVQFHPEYYECLIRKFHDNPALGLAGGLVVDVGPLSAPGEVHHQYMTDVAGATQFFRRECFESLGRLVPIQEGGWDALTCAMARMKGFATATFPDLRMDHLKPRNSTFGNPLRRKWQMGSRDYALGYHPLFEIVKCVSRVRERPYLVGSICWFAGFAWAFLSRKKIQIPIDLLRHVRAEQIQRLSKLIGL